MFWLRRKESNVDGTSLIENPVISASNRLAHRPPFTIVRVHPRDLSIRPDLQRPGDENREAKMKANFHPKGLGVGLIATVEGQRIVLDGQKRRSVVLSILSDVERGKIIEPPGFNSGDCMFWENAGEITVEEAAILFEIRNYQMLVSSYDVNRMRVKQGDPTMVSLARQATIAGYSVLVPDSTIPANLVDRCRLIVRAGNSNGLASLLQLCLETCKEAFGTPEMPILGTLDSATLQAISVIYRKNRDLAKADLVAAVKSFVTIGALHSVAGRLKVGNSSRTMAVCIRSTLIERFNKGKPRRNRIK